MGGRRIARRRQETGHRRGHRAGPTTTGGIGGGETVREISQDTPFSMVALTGSDLTGTSARVRAKRADGSWGPWYHAERFELGSEDVEGNGTHGTDPVYVGETTAVQIAVNCPKNAPVTIEPPQSAVDAGRELGYVPANAEEPLSQTMSAILITRPRPRSTPSGHRRPPPWGRASHRTSSAGRSGGWDRFTLRGPFYGDGVRAAVLHHTPRATTTRLKTPRRSSVRSTPITP